MPKKPSARTRPAALKPAKQRAAEGGGHRARLSLLIGIGVAAALLALGGWGAWSYLNRPLAEPDRAELLALRTKLTAVQGAIKPIALAFASRSASQPIDIAAYETKVDAARNVVESVNDVNVTSGRALEIRDSILNGGSDVLAGVQQTLDAMRSDDASAAADAAGLVDQGVTELDSARIKLDEALRSGGG